MSEKTDLTIGRLLLWQAALTNCIQCLGVADRMTTAADAEAVREQERFLHAFYNSATGRRFDRLVSWSNDGEVMDAFERELPIPNECKLAAHHLRLMAVVYFVQLHNEARRSETVADNKALTELLGRLELVAFPDADGLETYVRLRDEAVKLRNKQLGHADGSAFDVRHAPGSVTSREGFPHPLFFTDLKEAARRLRAGVFEEMSRLQNNPL